MEYKDFNDSYDKAKTAEYGCADDENSETPDFIAGNFNAISRYFEAGNKDFMQKALLNGTLYNKLHQIESTEQFTKLHINDILMKLLEINENEKMTVIVLKYILSLVNMNNKEFAEELTKDEFFRIYMTFFLNETGKLRYHTTSLITNSILCDENKGKQLIAEMNMERLLQIIIKSKHKHRFNLLILGCTLLKQNLDDLVTDDVINFFLSMDLSKAMFDSIMKSIILRCIMILSQSDNYLHILVSNEFFAQYPFPYLTGKDNEIITSLEILTRFYEDQEFSASISHELLMSLLNHRSKDVVKSAFALLQSMSANSNVVDELVANGFIPIIRDFWAESEAQFKNEIVLSLCNLVLFTNSEKYDSLVDQEVIELLVDILESYDESICTRQALTALFYIMYAPVGNQELTDVFREHFESCDGLEVVNDLEPDDETALQYQSFIQELFNAGDDCD